MRDGIRPHDRVYEEPRPAPAPRQVPKFMKTLPRQMQKFTDDGEVSAGGTIGRCPGRDLASASPRAIAARVPLPAGADMDEEDGAYTCLHPRALLRVFVVRTVVFAVVWLLPAALDPPNITSDGSHLPGLLGDVEFDDLDALATSSAGSAR